MCDISTSVTEAALIELHTATCAEISRYRDREWHNQGIFTAAIIAILGCILVNSELAQKASHLFEAALVLLAVGNIWFTLFAHNALTEQRNILARLRLLLRFHDTDVDLEIDAEGVKFIRQKPQHKCMLEQVLDGSQ
jgi:hypothetical protein